MKKTLNVFLIIFRSHSFIWDFIKSVTVSYKKLNY